MARSKTVNHLSLLLILPVIVALTSGCVDLGLSGNTGVTGNGVSINTFDSSLSSLESDDEVILHLEVQNQGDAIAKVAAKLIGIYPQDWDVFLTEENIGELLPADAESGTEGQIGTVNWQLRAPELKRGESRQYEPIARVFYSYETRVTKPITFVTSEELRRAVQNGEALPADATRVSAGPLSVTVTTGDFVRTTDNWMQSYFPVEIEITNTGGGLLAGENYPVGIEVTAPPGTMFREDCPRSAQSEWAVFDNNLPSGLSRPVSPNTVFLWDGKSTKITCELKVISPPEYREKRDLEVVLKYIYYADKRLQLSVTGTQEWGF